MIFKNFKDLEIELIVWEDISEPVTPLAWFDSDDIQEWINDGECLVEQVGYVIHEDENHILLAGSVLESHKVYSNLTNIPKAIIKKRVKWNESREL